MRVLIAEYMADALAMELRLGTASVKGEMVTLAKISDDLTIPFKLKVISHFDTGAGKDGALLLEGPGDLLLFLGYSEKTKKMHLALIDRSDMKRRPKEVMESTGFVDIAIKRFNEGDAVRGLWTQEARKDPWKDA